MKTATHQITCRNARMAADAWAQPVEAVARDVTDGCRAVWPNARF